MTYGIQILGRQEELLMTLIADSPILVDDSQDIAGQIELLINDRNVSLMVPFRLIAGDGWLPKVVPLVTAD